MINGVAERGEWGGELETPTCLSVVVWRNIMKGWDYFWETISFRVEDDRRVFFGDITGVEDFSLKDEYQSLHKILVNSVN